MIRFLHLSDLHLGWRPRFMEETEARKVQAERDRVLKEAVDYALVPEHRIDLIIIAGDLFETHAPEQELTELVIRELGRCVQAGKEVITVPGNHDEITYRDSVYRQEQERWPGILVTNPMPDLVAQPEIRGQKVFVYSLAYTGGLTRARPPIRDFPRVEGEGFPLAVFHGSYNWDAGDRSLPLDPDALAGVGYHYIALGHFHLHQTYRMGPGLGVYPGMNAGKGFHDRGVGRLLVGEWQPEQDIRLEQVPVPVPVFEQRVVDVSDISHPAQLADLVKSQGSREAMVQIELRGIAGFPLDPEWLRKRCRDSFRYLEIANNAYYLSEEQLEHLSREKTITGFFLSRMKDRLAEAGSEEERKLLNRALTQGILALRGGKQDA
ncbi:MAG: DNA repair exonuclease [Clostridia bacterium]|nr:DNA repair exonuclease [Clostridia bacterium]